MAVTKLSRGQDGAFSCPKCGQALKFVAGGAVRIVDGKVDMDNTLPKYECHNCGVFFRELLSSGFFDEFPLEKPIAKPKKIIATGDLEPMQLKRDANGHCACPRCGGDLEFIEGGAVRIVNGKPDMENVKDRFHCPDCDSIFRRILSTDYFQYTEN